MFTLPMLLTFALTAVQKGKNLWSYKAIRLVKASNLFRKDKNYAQQTVSNSENFNSTKLWSVRLDLDFLWRM